MTSAADTVQAIQKALAPYVRPREEAEHVRRVLALNLQSCHENGPQHEPLALVEAECTLKSTDARGLQRDYLKALHANIKAQREYESTSQKHTENETKAARPSSLNDAGRLEEHITAIKLRIQKDRLQTVAKYLDHLGQKPAASPDFLQPEEVFKGTRRLPGVPKTVVSGFTVDKSSAKSDLKALVDKLEKAVLRSKLLLKKEERLLEEVKSRSTASPSNISSDAKLSALNATRNELIIWMETELGKASAGDEPPVHDAEGGGRAETKLANVTTDEQLAMIKERYASYLAARKRLIHLVAQSPQPSIAPPEDAVAPNQAEPASLVPSTHLITPYIENLLSITHEQKASIAQKSHLNGVLAKQTEKIGRALSRLAEESQLLPDHPTRRRQGGHGGDLSDKGDHEIISRVLPWVSAADSAKLATLETVAEKIEEGQVALEASTKYLVEIDQLLGRNAVAEDESVDGDATEDDIWLAETQTPRKGPKAPPRIDAAAERRDVWSLLDGNLGLINAESSPHR